MIVLKLLATVITLILVLLPVHLITEQQYGWLDKALYALVGTMLGIIGGVALYGTYVIWTQF